MDYGALGLKVGLEIHQQIDTHKLFCGCPSALVDASGYTFQRRLRPTQSELGEVDAAAVEEAKRKLLFVYEATPNTCLVEADEEPPHETNPDALDTVLQIALLLGAKSVREVHFMRKIVIDGSNTGGFQRSALIATDGGIEVDGLKVGIPTILLEEDAARKVGESEGRVRYRLDRLGIPLVEVATTPAMGTPEVAVRVALALGGLLRATKRVMRGIGTIREDLNVSIRGGARVEIKGVQELRMISTYIENEVKRQLALIDAAKSLKARGVRDVPETVVDVTDLLAASKSKVVRTAVSRGGKVLALPLLGFAGLLKDRLGPELAAHARVAGVGGVFHTDELPGHGIGREAVAAIRSTLGLGEHDAFVLVADDPGKARDALGEVRGRAVAALSGVPEETRDPRPDGTTVYSRPLPGKARMYPETDVPPIRISQERIETLRAALPERPEVRIPRLSAQYGIHEQQARQLVEDGMDNRFEALAKEFGEATLAASTLSYTFTELRREGVAVDAISEDRLRETFSLVKAGRFAKEAIPDVLREVARSGETASRAAERLGLAGADRAEVERVIEEVVAANADLIAARGEAAVGALMGVAMERLRGRADGKLVSEVLRERIRRRR